MELSKVFYGLVLLVTVIGVSLAANVALWYIQKRWGLPEWILPKGYYDNER